MKTRLCSLLLALILFTNMLLPLGATASAPKHTPAYTEATVSGDSFQSIKPVALHDVRGYSYQLRHRYTYAWSQSLTTATKTQDTSSIRENPSDTLETTADVEIIPIQRLSAQGHILSIRLVNPHVWTIENGRRVDAMTSDFASQLARPLYVAQSANGMVEYIALDQSDAIDSQNLKRGIVESLFQMPVDSASSATILEVDPNGTVLSHYTRQPVAGSIQITRIRTEDDFQRMTDPNIPDGGLDLDHTQITMFDPGLGSVREATTQDFIASVRNDTNPYSGEGVGFWAEATGNGHIQLATVSTTPTTDALPNISVDASKTDVIASINALSSTSVYVEGTLLAAYTAPEHRAPANLTLTDALQALATNTDESYAPIDDLTQLFLGEPATISELRRLQDSGAVAGDQYPALATALAAANTTDAQSLLVSMVDSSQITPAVRSDILVAMLDLATPAPIIIDTLQAQSRNTADPLAAQALVVLGGLLNKLAAQDPQAATTHIEALTARLASATSAEQRIPLLDALGNVGTPELLDTLETYLIDPSADVRLTAVDSLRKLPLVSIEPLLNAALGDSDPEVASKAQAILDDLAPQRATTLSGPMITQTLNELPAWDWSKNIGGQTISAKLHAAASATKVNNSLVMSAAAGVDIKLWNMDKKNVVKVDGFSKVIGNQRTFGFGVYVLGNKVYSKNFPVPCETTQSGMLFKKEQTFFSAFYGIWIYGIKIGLHVDVGGAFQLDYLLQYTQCSGNATVAMQVKPGIYMWANGGITISIGVAKAGAGVKIEFLRTWTPITLTAQFDPGHAIAINIKVDLEFKAINVKFLLWYKRWKLSCTCWGVYKEWVIAQWSYGYSKTTIFNKWYNL